MDWLKNKDMTEVYSRIGPSLGQSLRSELPPKERRKKAESNRKHGVVKMFNIERQFGFITVKGEPDVFFHLSAAEDADTAYFMRGDRVTLEVDIDKRVRTCAKNVRLV
ncbi:Cold shock protein CspA [compost metagenome]